MAFVTESFELDPSTISYIQSLIPRFGFNGFGIAVYFRTYSRKKEDGSNESWHDTVIRITNGIFSIRKTHMIKNKLEWNDNKWQEYAKKFAISMFHMNFLPAGRGLFCCGTEFVKNSGSAALNN